jgi:hypothetical protein
MFNLEQSITEWRRQMLAAGINSPIPLDELENHLREDAALQLREGLSAEQAFDLAAKRIGQPGALKTEFKKVRNPEERRRQKKAAGIIFTAIYGFYGLAMGWLIVKHTSTLNERLSGFAALAATLLLLFAAWKIVPRFFPVIASKQAQTAMGLVGGVSGMSWFLAFAYLILPRLELTPERLFVAVLWAMIPVMVLPAVAFVGLDKNESRRTANTQARMTKPQ